MRKINKIAIFITCVLVTGTIGARYLDPWSSISADSNLSTKAVHEYKPNLDIQLFISLSTKTISITEPLILTITIKNMSSNQVAYVDSGTENDFSLVVTNEKGEQVPKTLYGQFMLSSQGSRQSSSMVVQKHLAPGEKASYKLFVNALYDMTMGKTFNITAKQRFPDFFSKNELISNTVSVRNLGINAALLRTEDSKSLR